MRTRETIEKDTRVKLYRREVNDMVRAETNMAAAQVELLLDIRDLLLKEEKVVDKGI